MNNLCIFSFSRIFLLGILICKGLLRDVFVSHSALKGYLTGETLWQEATVPNSISRWQNPHVQ
jgi:hypothetical protein